MSGDFIGGAIFGGLVVLGVVLATLNKFFTVKVRHPYTWTCTQCDQFTISHSDPVAVAEASELHLQSHKGES